jgi:signal transduction histidine kinase
MEDQLRQAQKLEAIGQLAAGIAHEINTPTQFVSDNVTFLKDSWSGLSTLFASAHRLASGKPTPSPSPDDLLQFETIAEKVDLEYYLHEIPKALDETLDGLQRISKIVRAIKEFSHPGTEEMRPTDINSAIQTTLTVSRNEWKYIADLETDFDPELPMVPCIASHFNQAMLNIIVNAAHAIAEVVGDGDGSRGRISVRTRSDGHWAEIAISDSGVGIPEEIRGRIFEPFFSTKQVGKGTGQGLGLTHAIIVKEHHGQIWFESKPGAGTTFFIRIPLSVETGVAGAVAGAGS